MKSWIKILSRIFCFREEDKRKYYQITDDGKDVLTMELKRIEELYNNGK